MAITSITRIIPKPRSAAPPLTDEVSDGQLLDRFIARQDEQAFEEIVRRHGLMVLGVCQRVLDNPHDAEDCFQAVFMVLVRKATTIQPSQMVGNWLYGVAYRTALEARKMAARRRNMEKKRSALPRPESNAEAWSELRPVLDLELSKLPDKYRFVLLSCDVEGKTRKEVAHALDLPEGTVASRLARARALLAKRLARRNLAISTGMLARLLADHAEAPSIPAGLTTMTVRSALRVAEGKPLGRMPTQRIAALTETVVQSMRCSRLEISAALLLVLALIGLGVSALLPSASAERKPDIKKPGIQKTADPKRTKPEHLRDYVLEKIDRDQNLIHATRSSLAGDPSAACALRVDPSTMVVIDGKEGNLADLKPGHAVHMQIARNAAGEQSTLRIEVVGEEVAGQVAVVVDGKVTVIPASEKGPAKKQKFSVDSDGITVWINGKKAKVGDLRPNMNVTLRITYGTVRAVRLDAVGPKFRGALKSIDLEHRRVALAEPMIAEDETVAIAADAKIDIDGKQSKLSDLQAGMRVTLQMSAEMDRRQIVAIVGETPLHR